jgi:hypothetical protein
MAGEIDHRILWLWTAPELGALVAVFGLLITSLVGTPPVLATDFASVSRPIRAAGVAFLAIELLIPLWVYFDLRRHPSGVGSLWVHVAAMPGFNLFGFVAYLQERKRFRTPPESDAD